jgi:tetratricopeptide (TPR) repeat protein
MASTKSILVTWRAATVALLVLLICDCSVLATPADVACKRGKELLEKKDYKAAIIALDQAISLDPKNPKAYSTRGLTYWYLGQHQKAIKDFKSAIIALDQAIKLDPKNAKAYVSRGEVHGYLGQYQKEIDDYSKLIELDPKNAEYYVMRGNLNFGLSYDPNLRLEQCQKAIDDFSKAIELNPFLAQAYVSRCAAYCALGNEVLAEKDIKKARELGYTGSSPF